MLGFILACFLGLMGLFGFFSLLGEHDTPLFHDQVLPSGKIIKVTSFNLVWGAEHDERRANQDTFALEYVSNDPQAELAVREQEAWEVFELIRPVSELWGFTPVTVAAFPKVKRKGHYDLFIFERDSNGKWAVQREARKVFIND